MVARETGEISIGGEMRSVDRSIDAVDWENYRVEIYKVATRAVVFHYYDVSVSQWAADTLSRCDKKVIVR